MSIGQPAGLSCSDLNSELRNESIVVRDLEEYIETWNRSIVNVMVLTATNTTSVTRPNFTRTLPVKSEHTR